MQTAEQVRTEWLGYLKMATEMFIVTYFDRNHSRCNRVVVCHETGYCIYPNTICDINMRKIMLQYIQCKCKNIARHATHAIFFRT